MNRALNIILCNIALYGCAHTDPDNTAQADTPATETQARTFVYECPDDFSFVARTETGKVWLFLPGQTIDLPQVASASGTRYSNGSDMFWSKADEALIETGDGKHAGCRNNRAKAIWEHAKLNGVDFRALGNEPGWYMEISNRQDILLVSDYGQRTYRFPSSVIKSEPHSRTAIYSASNDDSMIEVVIKGDPCRDSMSGEAFPATVSVRIDNKKYHGCGRALH
jgi:membrane-bound inhibitor of C-type lysozyme